MIRGVSHMQHPRCLSTVESSLGHGETQMWSSASYTKRMDVVLGCGLTSAYQGQPQLLVHSHHYCWSPATNALQGGDTKRPLQIALFHASVVAISLKLFCLSRLFPLTVAVQFPLAWMCQLGFVGPLAISIRTQKASGAPGLKPSAVRLEAHGHRLSPLL